MGNFGLDEVFPGLPILMVNFVFFFTNTVLKMSDIFLWIASVLKIILNLFVQT